MDNNSESFICNFCIYYITEVVISENEIEEIQESVIQKGTFRSKPEVCYSMSRLVLWCSGGVVVCCSVSLERNFIQFSQNLV